MEILDKNIEKFMNSIFEKQSSSNVNDTDTIPLLYMNQMSSNYRQREDQLKQIIKTHVKPTDEKSVCVMIYYKAKKLKNLLIKNSPKNVDRGNCSGVVYRYNCPNASCNVSSYIGYTTNTINTRMRQHFYNGAIKQHGFDKHNIRPTYEEILNNTEVLSRCHDRHELIILEALYIKQEKPTINLQNEGSQRVLKIF